MHRIIVALPLMLALSIPAQAMGRKALDVKVNADIKVKVDIKVSGPRK